MAYTIKEISREIDLAPHTLRYYENEGLMPRIDRDIYGNRVFGEEDLNWLRFVRCLRDTGMPIKEMKHFVELMEEGDHTVPDRLEILYQHKADMEAKIEQMNTYMENVKHKIAYYESIH